MNGFISTPKSTTRISEVFESRYLIWQLIRRDFFVRYKQTSLGILWAIINPVVNLMLYLFVFGLLVKVPTPEYSAPFSAVLVVGILFWNLFSSSMNAASDSLVNNVGLIKKVYFPRISLSISSVFVSLIDFAIALIFFIPCLLYIGVDINFKHFYVLLPCVFFVLLLGWGMGCFMAILKIKFKDFRHILPLLTQTLFYASPIVYTISIIPDKFLFIYQLNPMSGLIAMARWVFLGGSFPDTHFLIYSVTVATIIAVLGSIYFILHERKVVDLE